MFSILSLLALIILLIFKIHNSKPCNIYPDSAFKHAQMLKEYMTIRAMKNGKDKEQALLNWGQKYADVAEQVKLFND